MLGDGTCVDTVGTGGSFAAAPPDEAVDHPLPEGEVAGPGQEHVRQQRQDGPHHHQPPVPPAHTQHSMTVLQQRLRQRHRLLVTPPQPSPAATTPHANEHMRQHFKPDASNGFLQVQVSSQTFEEEVYFSVLVPWCVYPFQRKQLLHQRPQTCPSPM